MYTADHIFLVLTIKDLINEDSELTISFKLAIGMKPLTSHFRVLFCPCVVWKVTEHVGTKVLNMRHQSKNSFHGIFFGIPQHQK